MNKTAQTACSNMQIATLGYQAAQITLACAAYFNMQISTQMHLKHPPQTACFNMQIMSLHLQTIAPARLPVQICKSPPLTTKLYQLCYLLKYAN